MTEPEPPPPPSVTAAEPAWAPRGLWWRSAWPSIVLALAAFQLGVLATLAVVWERLGESRAVETAPAHVPSPSPPPVLAPAAAPAPVVAEPAPPLPAPATPARSPRHAATARPSAALDEIEIDSVPQGATVRIGGAVWGVTPLTAFLPHDRSTWIELELPEHQTTRTRWNPESGSRSLRIDLHPMELK